MINGKIKHETNVITCKWKQCETYKNKEDNMRSCEPNVCIDWNAHA